MCLVAAHRCYGWEICARFSVCMPKNARKACETRCSLVQTRRAAAMGSLFPSCGCWIGLDPSIPIPIQTPSQSSETSRIRTLTEDLDTVYSCTCDYRFTLLASRPRGASLQHHAAVLACMRERIEQRLQLQLRQLSSMAASLL